MTNAKLRSKRKKGNMQFSADEYKFNALCEEELLRLFPSPRYFQIHFGHVHEKVELANTRLTELMQSIERLESRLDQLRTGSEPGHANDKPDCVPIE